MLPILAIQPGHQKRFLAGHPWLYANEIVPPPVEMGLEPGQLVQMSYQDVPVAVGYFNKRSLISFRALSHFPDEAIDVEFFTRRLKRALVHRSLFYPKPFYRLIHAEADKLPGLIIDRFEDTFIVQINTYGMENLKDLLLAALNEVFRPETVYFINDTPIRQTEGLSLDEPTEIGKPITTLKVIENDVTFSIDLKSSQKTGWFYDHRENRNLIASLAKGKTVIDYFCYSGAFGIQAAKAGAIHVIGVDRSESGLNNAKRSAELNGVSDRFEFVQNEAFEDMNARLANNERFDIVVLDPPAFVKAKKDIKSGLKGYEKLIAKGIQLTSKNGVLMIASCSYHVKEEDLQDCLMNALSKNKRFGRIAKILKAGVDHPLHPYLPESNYLKGFLVMLD